MSSLQFSKGDLRPWVLRKTKQCYVISVGGTILTIERTIGISCCHVNKQHEEGEEGTLTTK